MMAYIDAGTIMLKIEFSQLLIWMCQVSIKLDTKFAFRLHYQTRIVCYVCPNNYMEVISALHIFVLRVNQLLASVFFSLPCHAFAML